MKQVIFFFFLSCFVGLFSLTTVSCNKDEDYTPASEVHLAFSTDTLAFDTVFVHTGTTTRQVRVFNRGTQTVLVKSITLQNGASSRFRLNVDGDTSRVVRDVEIAAGDSIFIFVQANIDPNSSTSPFLVEDAILFTYSESHTQRLPLTAYGRNAVYLAPQPGNSIHVIDCDHWDHTLPHVIIGMAAVDSTFTLHLVSGDELYFAPGASLIVWTDGCLRVQGSPEKPVLFTSLRHDGWYNTLPGQWSNIWLFSGSHDNVIDHALIENGTIGLMVDTNVGPNPTLRITNTEVRNMSEAGILGQGARIEGDNLLISNCRIATMALQYGGRYRFTNSTLANYWAYDARKSPQLLLNNWYESAAGDIILRSLTEASFTNCIIYGNYSQGEVDFAMLPLAPFGVSFNHCWLRAENQGTWLDEYGVVTSDCIWNQDPMFADPSNGDFRLKEDSPALGWGYTYPNNNKK